MDHFKRDDRVAAASFVCDWFYYSDRIYFAKLALIARA
jgi:hypothetical protein